MREADKLTREMEVQTQAAQAANEAKSRFLASMSHEIRTPMNAIIGMSDLMRTDNLDQTQREYFEDIKKMSRALLQIINDILDFSKIEAGQMDLHPVHFNLLALYDNICSMCRFTAAAKELEFRSVFDAAVPQVIYGDDIRFRQIMVNIVNNAVKYTREGFVEFLVNRVTEDGRDSIAFIVKDTGIGIKQEDFSKIFGAFQQADSEVNRGIIGTGLGLSITKKLVDIMGGTIRLESVYGKGSEFTVLLPLVIGDPSMMEKGDAAESEVSAETADVLVADDNRINLKVALAFLARHAIKADSALNGLEAIGMIQKKHYDLVFMDHMMPEMDGVEATRRIRVMDGGRYKTLPIVALSANAVTGAQETFFEAGMNDFISKPIEANVLNRALLKWLPPEKVTVKKSAAPSPPPRPLCAAVTFNKAAGLEKAMGDEPFYRQLLETFQADHAQDAGKIQEAVRAGNRELAHRLAHTLKSASAQIGGEALSRTAAAMESALGDKGAGCSPEELQGLGADLKALLEELHRIPAQDPPDRGRSAEANPQMPDNPAPGEERQVLSLMEELIPLLESGNTASIKRIDDIRKTFPDLEGRTAALIDGIENFEFKTALGILRSIKESWISRQRGEN
jgi:CheY-like chemotaxis protein/nitrogen-specific signal transduction histidine kinase